MSICNQYLQFITLSTSCILTSLQLLCLFSHNIHSPKFGNSKSPFYSYQVYTQPNACICLYKSFYWMHSLYLALNWQILFSNTVSFLPNQPYTTWLQKVCHFPKSRRCQDVQFLNEPSATFPILKSQISPY